MNDYNVMAVTSVFSAHTWNHDFPRLARDAGFSFDARIGKVITNWNDIKVIDIERIIRERDFVTIDEHLTKVLDCQLEKEFDVRILDSGFVKLFKLAQLSVEYLVQCRRLLDTSVTSLRGQMKAMAEEAEHLKKLLRSKEEEIRKLRNKSKKHQKAMEYMRTSDITNIFRKMMANQGQNTEEDPIIEAFHKCQYCCKIFLNQFYLHSHLSRRHPDRDYDKNIEPPSPGISPIHQSKYKAEAERLIQEIKELKDRVNATEKKLNTNNIVADNDSVKFGDNRKNNDEEENVEIKEDKVEMDYMEKETIARLIFDAWKKEEEGKFNEQIESIKKQLEEVKAESINCKEEAEKEKAMVHRQELMKMNEVLQHQENEVKILKEQLQKKMNQEANELKEKLEDQEKYWQKKLDLAEVEHEKRMREVNKNMSSLMTDAKLLQQQYMNRIELLEADTVVQKKLLENQAKKFSEIEQEKAFPQVTLNVQSSDRKNNFEEIKKNRVGESMETLPPYDEGSMENILKGNLHQKSNKTSPIMVKNITTADNSILTSNLETSDTVVKNNSPKKKHFPRKSESDSSDDERPQKTARKTLFSEQNKKEESKKRRNLNEDLAKSLSPVKNVQSSKKKKLIKADYISSENSDEFDDKLIRSKTSTPSKQQQFQRNHSSRESQRDRVLSAVKEDLVLILNKRLQQIGVARNNKGMPTETFLKNMSVIKHREQLLAKKYENYNKVKKEIIKELDDRAKEINRRQSSFNKQEISKSNMSLNKVGNLLSNVKNKALSTIKGIKKSANESIKHNVEKRDKENVQKTTQSPVKNSTKLVNTSQQNQERNKVSTASILSLVDNLDKNYVPNKQHNIDFESSDEESESSSQSSSDLPEPEHKLIVTKAISHLPSTSVENLLNSPVRKPSPLKTTNAKVVLSSPTKKIASGVTISGDISDVDDRKEVASTVTKSEENISMYAGATSSSDEITDYEGTPDIRKAKSEDNVSTTAKVQSQKGVLKSTVSTSALAKKKVLFDLDANQIKSRSTSPSVSATVEVKAKEDWEDTDDTDSDWNLSDDKIKTYDQSLYKLPIDDLKLSTKQSPKIAEISKTIGQQLGARNVKPPAGSVDTLFKQQHTTTASPKRVNVYNGSTTSIGSSIFEGNNNVTNSNVITTQVEPLAPVPRPRTATVTKDKIESDLELSDWSAEDFITK